MRYNRAVIYRLTHLSAGATRGGVTQSVDAEVRGIAKTNDQFPFTIANEVVAARLGQALGLPVPTGVIAEDDAGKLYYLSLDVSKTGHTLPPAHPPDVVAAEPFLAVGSVVFDFLIANEDRHVGNLSLDPAFAPARLSLFDHGHALLGSGAHAGFARLVARESDAGCLGLHGGSRQALVDAICDAQVVLDWVGRVEQLPDYIIEDACRLATLAGLNVDRALADRLAAWLNARKLVVRDMIERNRAEFSAISAWPMTR